MKNEQFLTKISPTFNMGILMFRRYKKKKKKNDPHKAVKLVEVNAMKPQH